MEQTEPKTQMTKSSLPLNVWGLGFVSLFNDIASEMIYPIIPMFLMATLGVTPAIVGLIEGIAEATSGVLKLISGWYSDFIQKRKLFVTIGYSLSGISKLLLGFAKSWPFVLFARVLDRFGKGTRTSARDALIVESVPQELRGRAFGLHRGLDSLGAVIGPLCAILLLSIYQNNYRLAFKLSVIPVVIGILILVIFVKEKKKVQINTKTSTTPKLKFSAKDFTPQLSLFLLISIIFGIGNSSDAFLILRAKDVSGDVLTTIAMFVVFNIFYSFGSYPAGFLSDKFGSKKILTIGFFLFALVYLGFGLVHQSWMVWILFAFYGIYMALTDGVSKAYISTMVPPEKSGTAFGVFQMINGFCVLGASVIAGIIWKSINPAAPFYYGAITAFIAGVIFLISFNRKQIKA